jgi:hypothetical protein
MAMSEKTLEKLRKEAREREYERKVEIARKEQVEKERAEQVCLIGAIYIEPLALRKPLEEEIRIFGEEKKIKNLEEELEATLNFLRRIMTSIVRIEQRITIILNSEEEVEIISLNLLLRNRHPKLMNQNM